MLDLPATLTHREAPDAVRTLAQAIRDAGRDGRAAALPIDAAALTDFDSSALAVLLECRRVAGAAGRGIELRNAPPRLAQLARLYGVDELLGTAAEVDQARSR